MSVVIREKATGTVLAEADAEGAGVLKYEGNLYFDPAAVKADVLSLTSRTYTCPYKGTCHYVDFTPAGGGDGARDVAWVYDNPKPGHESIKGRYGFYAGNRGGTRQE